MWVENACSTEVNPDTPHPVIDFPPNKKPEQVLGAMRLGSYPCKISAGTMAIAAYGTEDVSERHRIATNLTMIIGNLDKVWNDFGDCPDNILLKL